MSECQSVSGTTPMRLCLLGVLSTSGVITVYYHRQMIMMVSVILLSRSRKGPVFYQNSGDVLQSLVVSQWCYILVFLI